MEGTLAGRRRRALLAAGLIAAGLSAVALHPLHAAPTPTLDTNLSDYTLFAQRSLAFKGSGSGNEAKIAHGNIGVNQPFGTLNVCGGGSGHGVTMDAGSQIVAYSPTIGDNCTLNGTDVFSAKPGTIKSPVRSRNVVPSSTFSPNGFIDPTSPADPNYHWFHPAFPASGSCVNDNAAAGSTATIDTDNQVFCNLTVAKNATLRLGPNVHTIWVLGSLTIGNGAHVNDGAGTHPVQFFVRGDKVKANNPAVNFGVGASFVGDVDALPAKHTAGISLGRATNLMGRFWAQSINSDFGTVVNPPTTTSTSTSTSTTAGPPPTFNF